MGYIHDSGMVMFLQADTCRGYGGTWTNIVDDDFLYLQRSASDAVSRLYIPIELPHQNTNTTRGVRISSIDIWYTIATGAMDELTATLNLTTLLIGRTEAFEAADCEHLAFTYDTDHDLAIERRALSSHKMTLTLDTALWLPGTKMLAVLLYMDNSATSVFQYFAARVNYTFRI